MAKRRKTKKRKFVKPPTGLKSKIPAGYVGEQGIAYHKDFVYDKLEYTVLTIEHMSKLYKDVVYAKLKTIVSAQDAFTLPDGVNGWACERLDQLGRVYVLRYKGIEVALFFKRQTTPIRLQPGDKYPEGVMKEPNDVWQRLDIAGASARKANIVLTTKQNRLDKENELMSQRLSTLEQINDAVEEENRKLKNRLEALQKARREKENVSSNRNGKSHKKRRVDSVPKSLSRSSTKKNIRRTA